MRDRMDPRKDFPVSWQELHRDARALAWRLVALAPFEGIVAVTRGGLVPAAIVARELGIRLVDTVCVATYDDRDQGRPVVLKPAAGAGDGDRQSVGQGKGGSVRVNSGCRRTTKK